MRQFFYSISFIAVTVVLLCGFMSCGGPVTTRPPTPVASANDGIFTKQQADKGAEIYTNNCAACHGKDLRGTEGGTALIGERFIRKWKDQSLSALFTLTKNTMPKTNPHSLDDASYSD